MTGSTDILTSKTSTSTRLKAAAIYVVAAVCLVWVLRDFHLTTLLRDLRGMRWGWVAAAVALDLFAYVLQGWRWERLLRPTAKISVGRTTQAVLAGIFVSNVVPLRLGELVRAYLVSRRIRLRFSDVIPSMGIEHMFDGIWVFLGVAAATFFFPLPKQLADGARILASVLLAGAVVVLYFAFFRKTGRWGRIIREISRSINFWEAFLISGLYQLAQGVCYWMVMVAFGIPLNIWHSLTVFLIWHLGTAPPNAPANVGVYQFFTVLGLTLFGVDHVQATNFSLVVFVILTLPLTIAGFLSLILSGTSLRNLSGQVRQAMSE
ncbi:MAG: lysylphosphatidylglycerol synthase transmembrane domain-containing protein [Acidobacteria bacterium]|nr:lysylphosphatidylglycerol synthase transmembrane domain-containing protein [Acidobacteriota bacterium]